MKLFTVGTRGSKLALAQTEWVMAELRKIHPDVDFEVKIIKTKGDLILDKALDQIGDKGLFIKELEQELLDLYIDFAVHSMKDMPSEVKEGLMFARTPMREDPRDVLVLREGLASLDDVPIGGVLGTGSKRRIQQLKKLRPDLTFVPVRGNIETRMGKIVTENLDGVVLAAAGLHRLGLQERITVYLDTDTCLPAPAQGALAIELRSDDYLVKGLLKNFYDKDSHLTAVCERAFLEGIGGSCHVPIGAFATLENGNLNLEGIFGDELTEDLYKWRGEVLLMTIMPVDQTVEIAEETEEQAGEKLFETQLQQARTLGETAAKAVLVQMSGGK